MIARTAMLSFHEKTRNAHLNSQNLSPLPSQLSAEQDREENQPKPREFNLERLVLSCWEAPDIIHHQIIPWTLPIKPQLRRDLPLGFHLLPQLAVHLQHWEKKENTALRQQHTAESQEFKQTAPRRKQKVGNSNKELQKGGTRGDSSPGRHRVSLSTVAEMFLCCSRHCFSSSMARISLGKREKLR